MRTIITCSILAIATLSASPASAQTQYDRSADYVNSLYVRYLGRNADQHGLNDHMRALRNGATPDAIEAAILASPEYYARSGNTPEGYVAAMHRDVLGNRAHGREFNQHVRDVLTQGRQVVALHVLSERNVLAAPSYYPSTPAQSYYPSTPAQSYYPSTPIAPQPAPVIVSPFVYRQGVVVPSYRPAPVYVAPQPTISFRLNLGR
jgi:hypothetical protein